LHFGSPSPKPRFKGLESANVRQWLHSLEGTQTASRIAVSIVRCAHLVSPCRKWLAVITFIARVTGNNKEICGDLRRSGKAGAN
jgi:hypothetical protein